MKLSNIINRIKGKKLRPLITFTGIVAIRLLKYL